MSGIPVLLFLDVSGGELLLILFVVFLVLGPDKMPEMARKAGRAMNQMRKATSDLTREFKKDTSQLQEEISSAKSKINEHLENVSREINRTKAQVVKNLDTETEAESSNSTENAAVEEKPAAAPSNTENLTMKNE